MEKDKRVVGVFSNYGANHVDVFAPGVDLISLDSSSTYERTSGTSIAAPVVTGIAALLLSYYPELSPQQLITILKESSYKIKRPRRVLIPNLEKKRRKKTKFYKLSTSGGIVNAYSALIYIQENMNAKEKLD